MEKRTRSPNYPALSLPEALERVRVVYQNQHTHAAPREVVVKSMGYNSINGASATAISALHKYGLLDRVGEEVRVSDRAMRYLHPENEEERAEAIREAASAPSLFGELAEKFPGRLPNEEVLRNYLIRNGFAPSAVPGVIAAYRDTMELVERESGAYGSGHQQPPPEAPVQTYTGHSTLSPPPTISANPLINMGDARPLSRYDLEGGGYVQIVVGGDVETAEALEWVEFLVNAKRRELEKRAARSAQAFSPARNEDLSGE